MYSCAAISAFRAPGRPERATCASRADLGVSRLRGAFGRALARRAQFYPCPFGKRPGTG